jgi:hypothetical protein
VIQNAATIFWDSDSAALGAESECNRKPKPRGRIIPQPSTWHGRAEQISLDQAGCEARKTPTGGDVFFLDFSESGCQMTVSGTICALPERQNIMRPIDIDALSEAELIELNHKVVARLRFLSQMRSHSAMLDFRVGERVKFHPDGGPELLGTLTRYNKKTVTVVTDAGQHWNVSPGLLTRANPPGTSTASSNDSGGARFPDRSAEKLEAPNKAVG